MNILNKYGLKKTKARKIILDALQRLEVPISSEDLHRILADKYKINLATIYRNLNTFYSIGLVEKFIRPDGINYYSLTSDKHQHYMICDSCNEQIVLDTCPVKHDFLNDIDLHGFLPKNHIFEIHGLCSKCQEKANEKVGE